MGLTTPLPEAASTQYFTLDDDGDVLAARPLALDEQRPQVWVLLRTVEQIGDVVPLVPALADSVPQMVDQLVAVLARDDTPIADQVIEVPKVSCSPAVLVLFSVRRRRRNSCFLKQTVDMRDRSCGPQGFVPGQSASSTAEQIMDVPGPGCGFPPGRSSTARTVEQNVDIPVPAGGLHDLSDPGASSSTAVSRDERGQGGFSHFSPGTASAGSL